MSPSFEPLPDRRTDHRRTMAVAVTLAIHVLLAVVADMVSVYGKQRGREVAPTLELVDIEPPPPPPPPEPEPEPEVPPQVAAVPPPVTRTPRPTAPRAATTVPIPPTDEPPPPNTGPVEPGGSPTVALPSAPPSARGVAVRKGAVNTGRVGKGGEGGGTGEGSGAGSGDKPISVAMLKTKALPKGETGYFDARKDYPAAAKQLGVEGKIRVRLTVSDTGQVTGAVLINKLGHGLDEVALALAKKLEFTPATDTNDKPVPSLVVWTFTFTLPSNS
jgi:periplasmic protein TonB